MARPAAGRQPEEPGVVQPELRHEVDALVEGGANQAAGKARHRRESQPLEERPQVEPGLPQPVEQGVFHAQSSPSSAGSTAETASAGPSSRSGCCRSWRSVTAKRAYSTPVQMRSSMTMPRGRAFFRLPGSRPKATSGLPMQTKTLVVPNS